MQSEKLLEIDFKGDEPIRAGDQFGLGRKGMSANGTFLTVLVTGAPAKWRLATRMLVLGLFASQQAANVCGSPLVIP